MGLSGIFRSTSRLIRLTRGLLILLTALAIVGTIAAIHRMEAAPKFHIDGNVDNFFIIVRRDLEDKATLLTL